MRFQCLWLDKTGVIPGQGPVRRALIILSTYYPGKKRLTGFFLPEFFFR